MKKLLVMLFMLVTCSVFAQVEKNGTIYKKHPYITIVTNSTALFVKQDWVGLAKVYADTAKFYDPSSPRKQTLADEKKAWADIAARWTNIKVVQVGYPDGLAYDKDPFTVQSWWKVTAVNKKTKKTATFEMVQFDMFNKAGKIGTEVSYYDLTPLMNAAK
ncbi:hypothetical protein [Mucilaginibacter jinjuensis]|uniref:SnoaL-like protein n=1 Tax=Mucilaginibacter jinjuensis TaxID=1176721 RepID=A0ABY7T6V0_9SPHI|nr:hypothetical protein [Mucilaginibacter jinjuensis]WCT11989.1 hypothetical protein PQO05_24965 [Mucilaginibacter jinjuensis]